jgi:hypothetical protein
MNFLTKLKFNFITKCYKFFNAIASGLKFILFIGEKKKKRKRNIVNFGRGNGAGRADMFICSTRRPLTLVIL